MRISLFPDFVDFLKFEKKKVSEIEKTCNHFRISISGTIKDFYSSKWVSWFPCKLLISQFERRSCERSFNWENRIWKMGKILLRYFDSRYSRWKWKSSSSQKSLNKFNAIYKFHFHILFSLHSRVLGMKEWNKNELQLVDVFFPPSCSCS